jgi:hypothetical protein
VLTLRRFNVLAESYGADLQRWPQALRAEAEVFLASSSEARRLLAEARILDTAIETAYSSDLPTPGEQRAALERMRSGVAARVASSRARRPRSRTFGRPIVGWFHGVALTNLRWVLAASGVCAAIAAGLLMGSMYGVAPPTRSVLTLLQPAPIQIFDDVG